MGELRIGIQKRRSRSFELHEPVHKERCNITKLPKIYEIENRLQKRPFYDAILKLKEIDSRQGPMMKVRLLEQVNQMIKDYINKFWEGIPINEQHLTITQDTKIPIYIYIVIKAKLVNLAAHIKFIQEFTTSYVHENNLGSNLALYESAMTIVADTKRNTIYNVLDQNQIYKSAVEHNQSFSSSVFNEDFDPFVSFSLRESLADNLL